jgi:hypothetical protein
MAKEKLSGTRRGIGAADFLQTAAHTLRYPKINLIRERAP